MRRGLLYPFCDVGNPLTFHCVGSVQLRRVIGVSVFATEERILVRPVIAIFLVLLGGGAVLGAGYLLREFASLRDFAKRLISPE
jgi:hypothetical protein